MLIHKLTNTEIHIIIITTSRIVYKTTFVLPITFIQYIQLVFFNEKKVRKVLSHVMAICSLAFRYKLILVELLRKTIYTIFEGIHFLKPMRRTQFIQISYKKTFDT